MKRPNGISLFFGKDRYDRIAKFFTPVLFFLFLSICVFGQQGVKQNWSTKPVATVESLTKDAKVFDTFVDGGTVYLRNKPDDKGQDYHFIIVQKKDGTLSKKRIYPILNQ